MPVKMKRALFGAGIGLLLFASGAASAADEPITFRVAFTDSATIKIGDGVAYHPSYAAMLAFQNAMRRYAPGKVNVELYPNGRLGDVKSNLEQVLSGNLGAGTPPDGGIAPFYKNIQMMSAPYMFKDVLQAYDVLDGPFGQKMFDDMAAKSGLRVLASYENGGFRNFSNGKKVVKTPADMNGLKIRTMDSPVYMETVKASGAAPTPIAWMELYSALQTGVVDGQENSPITILGGSLQEVQKYYVLNGHVLGTAYLVASEKFLKSLAPELREAFYKAGREASIAARGTVRATENLAMEQLRKSGMEIYVPTAEEKAAWEKTGASAIEWLKANTDKAMVEELITAVHTGSQARAVTSNADSKAAQGGSSNSTMYTIAGVVVVLIALFAVFGKRKKA
ncbi:TRAP transporter substrate-binding protein DctP [Xanthobacteraceae bacterium Astr-EGSB]|uniref:TRAP transporter substrate-binding protein DctP n=1 Tax=Astrobacterium formosum TaxID=3069710 RepID=UPI0027B21487|nr:TRAP transporter substrate-binding protein DctP [Xanthobacteraceae bacterium Astr-EGSB]